MAPFFNPHCCDYGCFVTEKKVIYVLNTQPLCAWRYTYIHFIPFYTSSWLMLLNMWAIVSFLRSGLLSSTLMWPSYQPTYSTTQVQYTHPSMYFEPTRQTKRLVRCHTRATLHTFTLYYFIFIFIFETECQHANAKAHEAVHRLASFLSSREEMSQPGVEPPTTSLRFGYLSSII